MDIDRIREDIASLEEETRRLAGEASNGQRMERWVTPFTLVGAILAIGTGMAAISGLLWEQLTR